MSKLWIKNTSTDDFAVLMMFFITQSYWSSLWTKWNQTSVFVLMFRLLSLEDKSAIWSQFEQVCHWQSFSIITQNPQQDGLKSRHLVSLQIDEMFRRLQRENQFTVMFPLSCSMSSLYLSCSLLYFIPSCLFHVFSCFNVKFQCTVFSWCLTGDVNKL